MLITVEPLLVCTNGDWWHRVYIRIWRRAPFVTLVQQAALLPRSSQGFRQFCEIHLWCYRTFVHASAHQKVLFNIDLLQINFPVTILYSLSLMLFIGWGCLQAHLFRITSPCITPLQVFLAIVLLTNILLLFRVDVLKFSKYIAIEN